MRIVVWDPSTLNPDYLTSWYWTNNTAIKDIALGNVDVDYWPEIITGGQFHDSTRTCAQTTIWEIS